MRGETHAELGGFVGELADFFAGCVVAVNAGEAIAKERALEAVLRGGVFVAGVELLKRLVDVAVQAQLDALGGDDLRECLSGVADGRERMHHEHDVRLATGHAQMPGGLVIERQGLCGRARGVGSEQVSDAVARGLQVGLDPCLRLFSAVEAGPEVQHVCGGRGHGCCGLGGRLDHRCLPSSLIRCSIFADASRERSAYNTEEMRYLIVLLALAGLVDSVLALRIHMQDPNAAPPCAVTEKWDCGTVNHSRFAVFPAASFDEQPGSKKVHIPVATLGIIGYGLIALTALAGWTWVTLQLAEIGFFCAAMLSYLEAFVIQKWCIYCVWSQVFITAILLCSIVAAILKHRSRRPEHSAVSAL